MNENLVSVFVKWYYSHAIVAIFTLTNNFMVWAWRFFSIGYFLPRILSPWHRDLTNYGKGFDWKVWSNAFAMNMISRVVGAIARVFFIILGLIVEAGIILSATAVILMWVFGPVVFAVLILKGVELL